MGEKTDELADDVLDRRRPSSLELTAYHEAGHAVVAHALKLDLLAVSIEANVADSGAERRGHCACIPSPVGEDNAATFNQFFAAAIAARQSEPEA